MRITILTLFPEIPKGVLETSITGRAIKNGDVSLAIVDIRSFAKDSYGSVDDKPYGGGAGMVLKVDVLHAALASVLPENLVKMNAKGLRRKQGVKILLTSAGGTLFTQAKARDFSRLHHLVLIAGHYEGVDERIKHFIDAEVSIGKYVLTGGEIAACVIADAVIRLLPGVINPESLKDESYGEAQRSTREYPHYTRPNSFMGLEVPEVLLKGNHKEIEKWREGMRRP